MPPTRRRPEPTQVPEITPPTQAPPLADRISELEERVKALTSAVVELQGPRWRTGFGVSMNDRLAGIWNRIDGTIYGRGSTDNP